MVKRGDNVDPGTARFQYLTDMLTDFKTRHGDRLLETRNLFGRVALIDPHTHSNCGDGRGSVSQNYEMAMSCGLDFVFVTDHYTVEAHDYARMLEGISWGQEPHSGDEHIVVLNNEKLLPVDLSPAELWQAALKQGRFAFVPHPAGQGEVKCDIKERAKQLESMAGRAFAMELLNGLFKVFHAWDCCCEAAVGIWDALLLRGCRVTPLGGSDAHDPFSIGTSWTGVICDDQYLPTIVQAMHKGRCFASEAPMLELSCGKVRMGSAVSVALGQQLTFRCRVADYVGLRQVRLIADGQPVHVWNLDGIQTFDEELSVIRLTVDGYVRLEAISLDGCRAFSAPIYLVPAEL